jgi:hypothetical protein
MAQPIPRLQSEDPSVEHIAGKLVAVLRANHQTKPPVPAPAPRPPIAPIRNAGVIFGLPAADYHADPSLGASDLKRLLQAPAVYWWHSWMNPNRPGPQDSPARQKGRALHKLVLEGVEPFCRCFAQAPEAEAYPGALVTHDDFKAKCRELGEPLSGTKAELAKRIKGKAPDVIIFDEILATFRAMAERDGLEILSRDTMREVKDAAATIILNPHLARAFEGGVPEVSIFWVENEVPLKARFDYLKPLTIVDLKRFSNTRERPVDMAIRGAIAEYRYDIQARHYLDAYRALYHFAHERQSQGLVLGETHLPTKWHKALAPPDEMRWTWVFHGTDGPPVSKGRDLVSGSPALNRAARELSEARSLYRDCMARFGTDPWIDDEPVRELTEGDMAPWLRESVEVL